MAWQLVRYAINGGLITVLYAIVYALVVAHAHPQVANVVGYVSAVIAGYVLHSRVTFRGHGRRDRATQLRFAIASIASYGVNAFWTWLVIDVLHFGKHAPLIPICLVTPFLLFALNRSWVFR